MGSFLTLFFGGEGVKGDITSRVCWAQIFGLLQIWWIFLSRSAISRVILQIVGAYVFHGVSFRSCPVVSSSYCFLSYILGIAFRNADSEHVFATVLVPGQTQSAGRERDCDAQGEGEANNLIKPG